MTIPLYLLLLLIPQPYIVGGTTEHYIRPSGSLDAFSCPSQCHTLGGFVNASDNPFDSNSVVYFLPGKHLVERPIILRDKYNISFKGFESGIVRPRLTARFPCQCPLYLVYTSVCDKCAVIQLHNTSDIIIERFTIVIEGTRVTDAIGAINAYESKNLSISEISLQCSPFLMAGCAYGIVVNKSHSVTVERVWIRNSVYGMLVYYSEHLTFYNLSVSKSQYNGLVIIGNNLTFITALSISESGRRGLYVIQCQDVYLHNSKIYDSNLSGIRISNTRNINIIQCDISNSSLKSGFGIVIYSSKAFVIRQSLIMEAKWEGIHIYDCSDFAVVDTKVRVKLGVATTSMCRDFLISNVTLQNRAPYTGLYIYNSNNGTVEKSVYTKFTRLIVSLYIYLSNSGVIVYNSRNITFRACNFTHNNVTALKVVSSAVRLAGRVNFFNNIGFVGAAIFLLGKSFITVEDFAVVTFKENSAIYAGGAIFIDNFKYLKLPFFDSYGPMGVRIECFLQMEGNAASKMLIFENNVARHGGDVLYGGSLGRGCIDRGAVEKWECLSNCLLYFKSISQIQNLNKSSSLIASDGIGVCLCNSSGEPDCLSVIRSDPVSIYPGQTINITAAVVGQDFGAVTGSIFAQFLHNNEHTVFKTSQELQRTDKQCTTLNYTISSQDKQTVLVLTIYYRRIGKLVRNDIIKNSVEQYYKFLEDKVPFPLHLIEFPKYINITFLDCPLGFELKDHPVSKCVCHSRLKRLPYVTCNIEDQTIQRSGLVWVGVTYYDNGEISDYSTSKNCPYNYCSSEKTTVHLNNSHAQCNGNRAGTLCGGCQPGLSLTIGYPECKQCDNNTLALLIPFLLAGLVLVFVIKFLNITIANGVLNVIIFYVNIVNVMGAVVFPDSATTPLTIFIAWMNLDWGIQSCFFDGYNAYWMTWLQYLFPLYIWLLAVIIIFAARHSSRAASLMGHNSVPVLATLILLSYTKLFQTIIMSLSFTIIETPQGSKAVWSADGNIDYLNSKHVPLFLVALLFLLFLWLPYTLLLSLGQWLTKCKSHIINHLLTKLKPLLDAYCGSSKDKHRYCFGALLLVRAAIVLIATILPSNNRSGLVFTVALAALLLMGYSFANSGFYRKQYLSLIEQVILMSICLLCLSVFYINSIGGSQAAASSTLVGLIFIIFLCFVFYQIIEKLKNTKLVAALKKTACFQIYKNWKTKYTAEEEEEKVVAMRNMSSSVGWSEISYRDCVES